MICKVYILIHYCRASGACNNDEAKNLPSPHLRPPHAVCWLMFEGGGGPVASFFFPFAPFPAFFRSPSSLPAQLGVGLGSPSCSIALLSVFTSWASPWGRARRQPVSSTCCFASFRFLTAREVLTESWVSLPSRFLYHYFSLGMVARRACPPHGAGCPSAAGAASRIGHARFCWKPGAQPQSRASLRPARAPLPRRKAEGWRKAPAAPRGVTAPRGTVPALPPSPPSPAAAPGGRAQPRARRGTRWEDGRSGGAAQRLFHPPPSCSVEPAGLQPPPAPSRFAPSLLLLSWGLAEGASPSPLTFGIPRFANTFSPWGAFGCPYKNAFPHPQGELTFPLCAVRPAAGAAVAGFGGRAGWGRPRPTGDPKAVG